MTAPPASRPDIAPDRIHLRDHVVEVEVGAFADERGRRQRLRITVEAGLARPVTAAGDDVDSVLSYDVLVEAVQGSLAARRFDLLEAFVEAVAARVLAAPGVALVRVTAEKLDRVSGSLGVTIERRPAGDAPERARAAVAPHVEIAPESLPPGPAVVVPAAPGLPLPEAGDRLQLALLALDQGAWALAARLGVGVADSRTEIEAALAAGRVVVWAPARMVRAAADLADGGGADPARLADWLRQRLSGG